MKTLRDPDNALTHGLAAIRREFAVPDGFPVEARAAAALASKRRLLEHANRTNVPFVTLDPAGATDLDQAFAIECAGGDLLLRYAIADVAWFVDEGGPVDAEAWRRGTTLYLPDGKAALYPPALSEGAASLLPNGDRPAVVFAVRIGTDGEAALDGAERAVIRSRAKLAYDTVRPDELPDGFDELARRLEAAEARRGASRVDPPEQEVVAVPGGGYALELRPRLEAEARNAALSLATNLAVAKCLMAHGTGLFRVMAEPDAHAVKGLRRTAAGLELDWPAGTSLAEFERTLDGASPRAAAMMLAIRRSGHGASYAPYQAGETPWHAAMAATYAHATAPLRRLADRYVVRAALAHANGESVPDAVTAAFERLPPIMAHAQAQAGRIDRAVVDLAEAVTLTGREGERFAAVVIDADERRARIQLTTEPIVATLDAPNARPGDRLEVRLTAAEPDDRRVVFAAE